MLLPTLLAVIALFASLVLLVTGNAMLGTIAALRLEIDGFDPGVIGVVLAMTSLGFVLGSFQGVRIVQRVGHIAHSRPSRAWPPPPPWRIRCTFLWRPGWCSGFCWASASPA